MAYEANCWPAILQSPLIIAWWKAILLSRWSARKGRNARTFAVQLHERQMAPHSSGEYLKLVNSAMELCSCRRGVSEWGMMTPRYPCSVGRILPSEMLEVLQLFSAPVESSNITSNWCLQVPASSLCCDTMRGTVLIWFNLMVFLKGVSTRWAGRKLWQSYSSG